MKKILVYTTSQGPRAWDASSVSAEGKAYTELLREVLKDFSIDIHGSSDPVVFSLAGMASAGNGGAAKTLLTHLQDSHPEIREKIVSVDVSPFVDRPVAEKTLTVLEFERQIKDQEAA